MPAGHFGIISVTIAPGSGDGSFRITRPISQTRKLRHGVQSARNKTQSPSHDNRGGYATSEPTMLFNSLIADEAQLKRRADAKHPSRTEKAAVVIYFFPGSDPLTGSFASSDWLLFALWPLRAGSLSPACRQHLAEQLTEAGETALRQCEHMQIGQHDVYPKVLMNL